MKSYKSHFSRALGVGGERLHVAAHSHHLWPDVSHDAHARCWEDAARLVDDKWSYIFGTLMPRLRRRVADVLGLPDPETIAFAPSTHELVMRLITTLETHERPLRILTTDGEFHSFRRQWMRLSEAGRASVDVVPTEPFESFPGRFAEAAARGAHDLVYFSCVMFDSGYVVPGLETIVAAVPEGAEVVVDGYHHFMAVPTSLAPIAARSFYTSGGYKYAMSGEGACFMHCPPGRCMRPINTGWFAGFGHLTAPQAGEVPYATDGSRFVGATFDPTGAYRMDAVLELWAELGVRVSEIHSRVRALQERFLDRIQERPVSDVSVERLIPGRDAPDRGHFLTFRTPEAGAIHQRLGEAGIVTDYRNDRLRFGFGIYHDPIDIDELVDRLVVLVG